MGNICSTRDESDMREQQAAGKDPNNGSAPSPGAGKKNNKNVFKANPKGRRV